MGGFNISMIYAFYPFIPKHNGILQFENLNQVELFFQDINFIKCNNLNDYSRLFFEYGKTNGQTKCPYLLIEGEIV